MKLQDLVREIVAQTVSEKHLTAAEKKKKEDIVKAMKKTFKGPEPVMYAIATKKAEKLAEGDPQTTAKISNAIETGKIDPKEIEAAAIKASQGNADDLAILMVNAMAGLGQFRENELAEDDIDETRVSPDNAVDYLAHVLEYVWTAGKGNNSIDFSDMAQSMYFDMFGGDEINESRFEKGEDVGAKGKNFAKIAKSAAKQYGSKEAGAKVAGAILKKVVKEDDLDEAFKIDFDDEGNIIKTPAKDVPKTPSSGEVEIPKLDKVEPPKNKEVNEENNITPYKKGEIANNNSIHYSKNPYPKGSKEYDDFYDGWMNAETEKQMQHDNETFRKETGERYDESQQELDEFMVRRWQHYAGIK